MFILILSFMSLQCLSRWFNDTCQNDGSLIEDVFIVPVLFIMCPTVTVKGKTCMTANLDFLTCLNES